MSLYQLPEFKFPKLKKPIFRKKLTAPKEKKPSFLGLVFLLGILAGLVGGGISGFYFYSEIKKELTELNIPSFPQIIQQEKEKVIEKEYVSQTSQEEKIIQVIKQISPAVVSVIISKDMPVYKEYYEEDPFEEFFWEDSPFEFKIPQYKQEGTEKRQIGAGTGFIVLPEGMVLTNKHVVATENAEYTVITNDGKEYSAKILAKDPVQDLAILKIEGDSFKPVKLGDSSSLQIGQTVIAIGNALGEFENTVSVGVISGLGRTITASGGGMLETLEDVIQTDAAINQGNSGGPLLNLAGEVIGINTAMALQGENVGFAIPINLAQKDIQQIKTSGKISYPFLGVRYVIITPEIAKKENLPTDQGALVIKGDKPGEPAVTPNSPADKSGLKENDIILEFQEEKITPKNSLAKIISKYNPGDKVLLKILRTGKEITVEVILGEWK
ncbi:MAG: hypothetical protein COS24_01405 [Candidatus Nealsonbacteria bacterium CG02_land_8_20_14_3_00_34_20]|uniref:PDZ domain-containing protein n=1 Tax=Candidatus Nealsonbacteria bacterium CG02_land_8_20_14_3_00_34_20 TaxID=1974698 RepID=A0A2M7DB29_9BACT|nr:MAG: hypothetical protein COS24_01405 [Candidatus Nealsonbacteria bacterium CG02_land_8_20_14_3_00_34_20]